MPPNLAEIRAELAERARVAEQNPMPEGLSEEEQLAWLQQQIERRRAEMGLLPPHLTPTT